MRGDGKIRCINCTLRMHYGFKKYAVKELSSELQNILRRWLELPQLPDNAFLCQACYIIVNESICGSDQGRRLGHTDVCLGCGSSVKRARTHILEEGNPLLNIFQSKINLPGHKAQLCHGCWIRGNQRIIKDELRALDDGQIKFGHTLTREDDEEMVVMTPDGVPIKSERTTICEGDDPSEAPFNVTVIEQRMLPLTGITLPNYKRSPNTSAHCVFNNHCGSGLHHIPTFIKVTLLKQQNFYIPQGCRVCEKHLRSNTWDSLPEICSNITDFTAEHIEDMIDLAKREIRLDFENVQVMPNHICEHWTGLTVSEFLDLFKKLSLDNIVPSPKTSLAIYLIKLRTGDSNSKLAPIFQIARTTLGNRMRKLKEYLSKHSKLLQKSVPYLLRPAEVEDMESSATNVEEMEYHATEVEDMESPAREVENMESPVTEAKDIESPAIKVEDMESHATEVEDMESPETIVEDMESPATK